MEGLKIGANGETAYMNGDFPRRDTFGKIAAPDFKVADAQNNAAIILMCLFLQRSHAFSVVRWGLFPLVFLPIPFYLGTSKRGYPHLRISGGRS